MADVDKIALTLTLLIIVAAVAFAFGVVFRRLSEIERQRLVGSPAASGPVGFVHF
jgi:hypothetical protein